jgi:DNA-3-methyladenine glycosylase I
VTTIDRCSWATGDLLTAYHDEEWGSPLHDDRALFEFLILEGAQAGLSWETILRKRHRYREVFEGFDPERVAALSPQDVETILTDPGIIRNRRKVESTVENARAFLAVREATGSFDSYIWSFVDGAPIRNTWRAPAEIPAMTPESAAMSKDLRRRGFSFVGPTICYAFMQATGMVNDHLVSCFRWEELTAASR